MRNETIRGNSILLAGAILYLAFALFGAAHASETRTPYPMGRLVANCGPGRPCPPPPPVQRGHLPPPPVQRGRFPVPYPRQVSNCPPMTVYNPRIGRCVADPYGTRRIQEPPPVLTGDAINDSLERSATNLANAALRGLDCGHSGDALRRLANQVLELQATGANAPAPGRAGDPGEEVRRKWRVQVESPAFWKKVWNRMADAYRSCNRDCFDDGISVGMISATAYCSASVALDGLPGPGYIEQTPLPVCQTSIFAGCVKSYGDTAATTAGCTAYTTAGFTGIFAEYQSQDCHLE